jgi:hypothetical protein
MAIQNGTHPSPSINPVLDGVKAQQDEMNIIDLKLRDIRLSISIQHTETDIVQEISILLASGPDPEDEHEEMP